MAQKYSICFAGEYPKPRIGGIGLQNYLLAREFIRYGWKVYYLTWDFDPKTEEKTEVDEGIILHRIRARLHFTILGYNKIIRKLREIDSNIYYQMGGNSCTGIIARYVKLRNKKFIWSSASDIDCEKHKFFKRLKESKGNVLKKYLLLLEAKMNDLLVLYGIKKADRILVQTKYQQDQLRNHFNIESIVMKDGHPIPSELPPKDEPPVVLWISNLKPLKQPEIFIELAKECRDLDCRFVFAGYALDKGYLDKLLKQMEGLSNIKYLGGIPFEESNKLIGRSSIFINTSEYEGVPNTFMQAWMRKTPTVSLNVDPDDIIKKYQLGFHSNTFDQLVKDVRLLIKDAELRKIMGENAYHYSIKEYDIGKKYENLLKIIQSFHE